jgi:hypothetical protein
VKKRFAVTDLPSLPEPIRRAKVAMIEHGRSRPREDYERQVGIAGICGFAGLGYTGQRQEQPDSTYRMH